jgi:hypothetical protein
MLTQFKEAVSVLTPSKTENVPAPVTGADSRGSLIVITPNPKDPPMLPIRPESGPEDLKVEADGRSQGGICKGKAPSCKLNYSVIDLGKIEIYWRCKCRCP